MHWFYVSYDRALGKLSVVFLLLDLVERKRIPPLSSLFSRVIDVLYSKQHNKEGFWVVTVSHSSNTNSSR